jgi:hypothetical protein
MYVQAIALLMDMKPAPVRWQDPHIRIIGHGGKDAHLRAMRLQSGGHGE